MKSKLLIMEPFRNTNMERISQLVKEKFSVQYISRDCNEEELKRELKEAEIVIGQPPLALLQNPEESCAQLKLVQMTWAGTDIYTRSNLKFPKERIALANASGTYGMIMSQFVVGMILSVMLNFKEYHTQQQNKIWEKRGPIQSLVNAKVLIYGAGDIGTAIAKRLSGFETYCIGVCRNVKQKRNYFNEICVLEDAEQYLSDVDIVIGCIPASEETEGYMNYHRLKSMKKNSIIVNVGRGNFIDCMALNELLNSGHLWGAALDVTNPEPLPVDHPLWDNPKCMITPHASGTTFEHLDATEDLLCDIICDNLSRYCNEEALINRIY